MVIGTNFYADQAERDFQNLSNLQSAQALGYGDQAARYADPFMEERKQYQNALSKLISSPGEFSSSPFYKFAYDQGLNALQRKGNVRSGNKLAELMRYGQGMATQTYFPQANLLSNLAMSGSSPAAAGLSYARGTERSQDYAQMAAAAKAAAQNKGGGQGGGQGSSDPFRAQTDAYTNRMDNSIAPSYENYSYYQPVSGAGTGYVSSDYGTYNFGSPAAGDSYYTPSYSSYSQPSYYDTPSYDSYYPSSYDYGYDSGYGGGYDYGYGGDYASDYYGGWDEF
jgi:hypothetical protein